MIKKILFNNLTIKNFRNINEFKIDFNETKTEILASNGVGKTNMMSAIMWCLFGKNIDDVKQFTISPIIDGKEDNSINTVVKMVVNDNYIIERSYFKRTTSLKSGYIIDGKEELVSITQSKYKEELIENLVDEETFKSLSNINYIPNLHWKDLKQLIFDLIGDIKDEEVLLRDDFTIIEEYITKFGINQAQKLIIDTDKDLKDDVKRLETEYQTLINTKEKYVVEDKDSEILNKRKEEIEKEILNDKENYENGQFLRNSYETKEKMIDNAENDIRNTKNSIEFNESNIVDYEKMYKDQSFDIDIIRNKEISGINYKIDEIKDNITKIRNICFEKEHLIEIAKRDGKKEKEKEIKIEKDSCSTCGQKLPEDLIESSIKKLKEEQWEKLTTFKETIEGLELYIKKSKEEIEVNEKTLETYIKERKEIEVKVYNDIKETDKQKQIRVAKEQKEIENNNLKANLEIMNETVRKLKLNLECLEKPDVSIKDNSLLLVELQDINNKLATSITLNKISEDIDVIAANLKSKKDNLVSNKDKQQKIIRFNNIKADLLKQKVRNYFNVVEFITKEYTQDGQEQETFKIANDKGVEWKDINTGHKILLGVDLLQGIMKAKETFVPILIDNGETITSDIEIKETQLLIAKAVKGVEKL